MCGGVFDYKTPPSLQRSSWTASGSNTSESQWHITNSERKPPGKIAVKSNYSLLRSRNSLRTLNRISDSADTHADESQGVASSSRTISRLSDRGETSLKHAVDESHQDVVPPTSCKVINLNMPIESCAKPHTYTLKCHTKRAKGIVKF